MGAGGGVILNDRIVMVYSIREAEGSWLLDAAVLLRGSVSYWYRGGPAALPPSPFSQPRGSGGSAGRYYVSIVRADREVWIDTTLRVPLENFNVLLLDGADGSGGMPVIHERVSIAPELGPGGPAGNPQSSREGRFASMRAAITELQRRLESCEPVANYLRG